MSFDVTSLFTNVPLHEIIEMILRRVYIDHEDDTRIPKNEVKERRTKNIYFVFKGEVYI